MKGCLWLAVVGLLAIVPMGFCQFPPPPPPIARVVVDFASAQGFLGVGDMGIGGIAFSRLMMCQGQTGIVQIVVTRTSIIPDVNLTVRLWFHDSPPDLPFWLGSTSIMLSPENMTLPEGITASISPSEMELSTDTPTIANLSIVAASNAKLGDFKVMVDAWISPTLYRAHVGDSYPILVDPNGTLSDYHSFLLEVTGNPDLNRDGVVDILDIVIVARAFSAISGNADWNPVADLNGDGVVNIIDVSLLARISGKPISIMP